MPGLDDVNEDTRELVEDMAEDYGEEPERAAEMITQNLGIDLPEVTSEDAKKAREAYENDDVDDDQYWEVIKKYSDRPAVVQSYRETIESGEMQMDDTAGGTTDASGGEGTGNGEPPEGVRRGGSSGGGGNDQYLTKAEAERMIPSANEIAAELQQDMAGGGGAPAGGGGGGGDPQDNMLGQMMMKMMMNKMGGGGGQMAELGQEFQKQALSSMVREMRKPDLGDMLEMRYYEEVMGSEKVDDLMGDFKPDEDSPEGAMMSLFEDDDDEDSDVEDDSGWF